MTQKPIIETKMNDLEAVKKKRKKKNKDKKYSENQHQTNNN